MTDGNFGEHVPDISEPYSTALQQAVEYLRGQYAVLAVIAAGSVLRGCGHASSDLDLYVMVEGEMSRRISKLFNGVPVEMFLNPPAAIRVHFAREQAARRPCAAHMVSTGVVVFDPDNIVPPLREEAMSLLSAPPVSDENALTLARYSAANAFENATDIAGADPAAAFLLMARAVYDMLEYVINERGMFSPREKDIVRVIEELDPLLGAKVREWTACPHFEQQMALAGEIADLTLGTRGFFEWESTPRSFI